MAAPHNARILVDSDLKVTANLPNADTTVNASGIDLMTATPYPVTEQFTVKVSNTTATGTNTKNVNIRVMDSADNTTFANVAVFANPLLRTTAANDAYPASSVTICLPPTIKRFVRATALGETGGGDSSDGTFSMTLLF